jgi:hypothetical protein
LESVKLEVKGNEGRGAAELGLGRRIREHPVGNPERRGESLRGSVELTVSPAPNRVGAKEPRDLKVRKQVRGLLRENACRRRHCSSHDVLMSYESVADVVGGETRTCERRLQFDARHILAATLERTREILG